MTSVYDSVFPSPVRNTNSCRKPWILTNERRCILHTQSISTSDSMLYLRTGQGRQGQSTEGRYTTEWFVALRFTVKTDKDIVLVTSGRLFHHEQESENN